ncbi:unnamed protein product [Rotaria sp. Silwood2]|nr:unnamed protein product [Rotaria sp. Silwood2]
MSNEQTLYSTNRKAIDSSGSLGSLYDGYKDRILLKVNVNSIEKQSEEYKVRHCIITNDSKDQKLNILQMMGVENELRLSILLNIREKTGISAIIDYSYPINEYTRFFYYSYLDREEQLSINPPKIQSSDESSKLQTSATHIITGIQTGIDIIIVLELPSNKDLVTKIDRILHRIRNLLLDDDNIFKLTSDDERVLESIIHTKIYSNTRDIQNMKRFYDICRYIKQNQNKTVDYPLSYTLRPIKWLFPTYTGPGATFILPPPELNNNIEQNMHQLRDNITKLEISIKLDLPKLLNGHLKDQISNLQKSWSNMNEKFINEIERLAKLVIDIRSGRIQVLTVDQALNSNNQTFIKTMIRDLNQNLNDLKNKAYFISELDRQQFRYVNIAEHNIDKTDNEKTIERKLVQNGQRDYILCSNDVLNKTKPEQLRQLRCDAIEEFKNNSNLCLIYADFSYCSFELKNMMKLPSNKYTNEQNASKRKETTSSRESQTTISSSTQVQTNTQNTDPLFTNLQTFASSQTKPQSSISLQTERQTAVSTSAKVDISTPASFKPSIISPHLTKTQTNGSLQVKPQASSPLPTERQIQVSTPPKLETTVSTSIKVPTISPLYTKAQVNASLQAKPQTFILPPVEIRTSTSTSNKMQTPVPLSTGTFIPTTLSPQDTDVINILLLGETGVGKSTFINAFVNYLTFASLQQAHSDKPVVLIPVSFLMTVGDNFEEHIVRFGNVDGSNNEDFDHPGQSVTQRCKSYVFHLNGTDEKNLRIIDTPGFGDTRGIEQDDRNMEHILEYLSNLTHLNAICFLLKPNTSRLNISFRSCLTQLFSLLDRNALNNIIFCFTSARSTFYTSGNTAPLVKKMLSSLSIGDVPFKKENTFCFDSKCFRFLVALQNGIKFNDDEKHKYVMSWSTSVTQSKRLIDYIRRNVSIYSINSNLQSIKNAQFEIIHMIDPMLETMRNILRNLILLKMNSLKPSIQLYPKVLDHSMTICLLCKGKIVETGPFLVRYDIPHKIEKNCRSCQCPYNQHRSIGYIVEYHFVNKPSTYDRNQMNEMLYQLCHASAEFSYFLTHIVHSSDEDRFMSGLLRIIRQEVDICESRKTNHKNPELVKALNELKNIYEQEMNELKSIKNFNKLSIIYKRIKDIGEYPMVREQMVAVKQAQKMMMKENEYEVPKNI